MKTINLKLKNIIIAFGIVLATHGVTIASPPCAPDPRHPECWVDIWEDDKYEDTYQKLYGPVKLPNMNVCNKDWGDQIDSLIVGPRAEVIAWEDENFQDTQITFLPNQRVSELDELNFGDDIDSMEIRCR